MRALLLNVAHGEVTGTEADHPRHHVAPIDLAICAAMLEEAGWRVEIWDTQTQSGRERARLPALIEAKAPDLLLLRPMWGCDTPAAGALVAAGRAGSLRLLLGPNAARLADSWLGTDGAPGLLEGALVGEPEGTFAELLDPLAGGTLPADLPGLRVEAGRLATPRPLIRDLDRLPLPAHRLLMNQGYTFRYPLDVRARIRIGYVLSSRGCAHGCIFCSPAERETVGTSYRAHSAERVAEEMAILASLGANAVYFIDDFFGFSKARIRALCEAVLARGAVMPWGAQVRARGLDAELLALMRRAGCSTLCVGAESGSDRVLGLLRKGTTTAQIREQCGLIRAAGIQLVAFFMVGIPGETDAERASTYALIDELKPEVVQLHVFNVFPGSRAMELYPDRYDGGATKFTGPTERDPHAAALDAERRRFYRRYYLSPGYFRRNIPRRWRPLLANLGDELDWVRRSTLYFLGRR